MEIAAVAEPSLHAFATLALTGGALFLFTRERIPLETSSLFILVALTVGFSLFPLDGLKPVSLFAGFGHEALVAVCALMVAGQGLVRTGALEPVGSRLARLWQSRPFLSLLATLLIGAILSAFVNNTPIVVLLLPILVSVSIRTGRKASAMLMPMGLATLIGGMATTIGTSTNLLVVSVAADMGVGPIEMFDFVVPAAMAGCVGILYLWLVAPRITPDRTPMMADVSPRLFAAALHVPEGAFADGVTLSEAVAHAGGGLKVSRIVRGSLSIVPLPDVTLQAGDVLLTRQRPDKLKEYERSLGVILYSGETLVDDERPLTDEDQQVAELVVAFGSPLAGATLTQTWLLERFKLTPIALSRAGRQPATSLEKLVEQRLRVGDVLLVQGGKEDIAAMRKNGDFMVLDATLDIPTTAKAPLALLLMVGVVAAASLHIVPIAVSATAGALAMVVTGCLRWEDAVKALSTQIILVVVASLALGHALLATGGAEYVASTFVASTTSLSPAGMMSGLLLVMAVLTNVVSNNAAAVIGVPIAVSIARQIGVAPEPFVMAVLFGANMSYATPMAYKTNLLVMNAGGYKFADFVKVGAPLTLLLWGAFSLILPWWYGV
jgi:di/tricarboxylate transporter